MKTRAFYQMQEWVGLGHIHLERFAEEELDELIVHLAEAVIREKDRRKVACESDALFIDPAEVLDLSLLLVLVATRLHRW